MINDEMLWSERSESLAAIAAQAHSHGREPMEAFGGQTSLECGGSGLALLSPLSRLGRLLGHWP